MTPHNAETNDFEIEIIDTARYYDQHAVQYIQKKIQGELFYNECIEMPAVLHFIGKELGQLSGKSILDVGRGLGLYSKILGSSEAKVTAIDCSKAMINETIKECKGLPVTCLNENFYEHKPRPESSYDLIIAGFMLGYFECLETAFNKFASLLKQGGVVITSSIHPAKCQNSDSKYQCESTYLTRKFHYADFLDIEEPLKLFRWIPSKVTDAASAAGFEFIKQIEPNGTKDCVGRTNGSSKVIIYIFIKK
jgi:2-polyprenyl-3-methyl-5-hydroxy-6-metoxy-1,4-benzoquinol methylase